MNRLLVILALLALADNAWSAEPCTSHAFVSKQAQGADSGVIGPDQWNQCHVEGPKTLTFTVGCTASTCAVLANDDDINSVWANDTERTLTITQVTCKSDAGNPTIQLQRDDGSATNMFTSNMTCDPTPTGTDGTDGILTSFISGENVLSPGHWLNFLTIAAGGTAKKVTVSIKMTVPSP